MRLSFPNLPDLGRVVVAVKHLRWRDPLVQAWALIGVVFLSGIGTHYVRSRGGGEQKNTSWAAELLHDAHDGGWRPEISLSGEGLASPATAADNMDLRACAEAAAARKSWQFLAAETRREIAGLTTPVRAGEIIFSGTQGGDAKALDLYFAGVCDVAAGVPASFVIGNGRRSRDGGIETTRRWSVGPDGSGAVRICLVGDGAVPTASQWQALGEIINCIEARSGRVALSLSRPQSPELLAALD
jgi:hypothetical protein